MTVQLVSDQKIAETSSKGNQEKWQDGNIWYKLDQFGYEALAEVFTSQLLEYSNIETDFPFSFVRYRMERLLVHGRERTGCSSPIPWASAWTPATCPTEDTTSSTTWTAC